jgi:sigma-B regulation protein RsbU (phosphoserine phosphatase)
MVKKHTWKLDPADAKIYLQNLVENIPDILYFKDLKSRFKLLNYSCLSKHGFDSLEDAIGRTDADVFSEEHAKQALADEQLIIRSGQPLSGLEEKETWPDGSVTWVSTTKMPLRDWDGSVIGTFGISRDITAKKEAELLAAAYADEIKRLKDVMEDDLHMAGELQKAFFPQRYPVFPADATPANSRLEMFHINQSSGIVGGDLCTIKRISETEAGIFLCDVMGHGVRAALGTAIVRSMIEDLSHIETDPGKLLARMNHQVAPIFQRSLDMMFITAIYLIIDTSSGEIRYASAGHPTPLIQSGAAGEIESASASLESPALALLEEFEFQTVERVLKPGDTLLLYTDGTYEACNEDQEQYGISRIGKVMTQNAHQPVKDMLQSVLEDLHDFSHLTTFEDDVCMVALRWKG